MRTIKFRAWNTAAKAMYPLEHFGLAMNGDELQLMPECEHYDKPFLVNNTDSMVYMQFTGLLDKNGKEVYQGDILRVRADIEGYGHTSYGGLVEVTTQVCGYGLRPFAPSLKEIDETHPAHEDGEPMVWDSSSLWHVDDPQNVEVIGNVHEHPSLLEAK
jgi:uncharacterized phage protein (TIGR01671 family)